MPARAIYFGTYSNTKHLYSTWNNGVESSIVHMFSAATSGTIVALVTNPIWLVKTRMQLQSTNSTIDAVRYKNAFHCAYLVIKTEGVRALYKGFSASLIGLSESTLQFVTYEALKSSFNNKKDPSVSSPPNWLELFSAAAVAKLGATLITYPHEVLRTRLRQSPDLSGKIKYTGLAQATKLILKEEGVGAFYGGMTAHIMRVVPNAAILFFSYELILYWYENRMKERE